MLRPYLKIWELIFGHAVKVISSPGICSPWSYLLPDLTTMRGSLFSYKHYRQCKYDFSVNYRQTTLFFSKLTDKADKTRQANYRLIIKSVRSWGQTKKGYVYHVC